ncbi:radical SAM protein, partial [Patescibacteria group bacterium]|nr:radical SAM protein [Patescibacteria group bacterium]
DSCEFCSVIQMCGRMKYRPVESVLEELQRLIRIYGPGVSVFFCSDNFFAYKKQAIALLKGIIELDLDIEGGLQMRADTICNRKMEINEEILSLMWDARIRMQYLGLESPKQETLDSYNKRLKVEQIEFAVKALVAKGFHTHGMFALGGDTDDEKVFRELVKFCHRIGIHTVQFLNLMPLPGTPLTARLESEDRVLSREWWKYNGNFAVIIPKQMSSYSLQMGSAWASAKFYSRTWTIWLILLSLPKILWLLLKYNRLKLNAIKAAYALLTKKKNILKILTDKLPSHVQTEMKLAISLPVIRLWALNQVKKVKAQVRPHMRSLRENQA